MPFGRQLLIALSLSHSTGSVAGSKENGTFRLEPSSLCTSHFWLLCTTSFRAYLSSQLMLLHPDWILGRSSMLAWRPTPDYVVCCFFFFGLLASGALSDMTYAVF